VGTQPLDALRHMISLSAVLLATNKICGYKSLTTSH
jgi:hypothetical protein